MRTMDFTTEQPDCCQVGDYLEVEENQLPTSLLVYARTCLRCKYKL